MLCVCEEKFLYLHFLKNLFVEVFVKFEIFDGTLFLVDVYLQSCIDWSLFLIFSKLDVGWVVVVFDGVGRRDT